MKRRGLGKGLGEMGVNELLSASAAALAPQAEPKEVGLTHLALNEIKPGRYQPRRVMNQEALEELANSIRSQGIIQPIIVRKTTDGYEIIAGERRWRAAAIAELEKVPVVVRELSDEAALAMSLIENIQRQDLNVMEEADALNRLLEEFKLTHQQVATAVGKSRASVTNILRLLKLNADIRALVEQGHLDMGHARALLTLEPELQNEVANAIVARSLSVRDAEALIRRIQEGEIDQPEVEKTTDPDVERLIDNLSTRLGAKVMVKHSQKGRGKLIIQYKSIDQLDEILQHIQ